MSAHVERQGWTVVGIIGDYGRSAWKGNHLKSGELGRFADRGRSGEIASGTILVVEALDRLSRQEWRDARNWLEEMTDAGLRIATVEGAVKQWVTQTRTYIGGFVAPTDSGTTNLIIPTASSRTYKRGIILASL